MTNSSGSTFVTNFREANDQLCFINMQGRQLSVISAFSSRISQRSFLWDSSSGA